MMMEVFTPGISGMLTNLGDDGWSDISPGESGNLLDYSTSDIMVDFQSGSLSGGPPLVFQPYGNDPGDCTTYLVLCEECGATFSKLHAEDFVLCRECDKKPKKYTSQSSRERRIILD